MNGYQQITLMFGVFLIGLMIAQNWHAEWKALF